MKAPSIILSSLLLVLTAGCADFEGVGQANTPNIDDPQNSGQNDGTRSALIFGADRDQEARSANHRSGPEPESNLTPPATPIH